MNNLRIPGFPSPEDQDVIQFYFFRNLSYTARFILYISLILAGFIIQIITVSIWPGAVLLISAVIVNLVKGYSVAPKEAEIRGSENWARTSMDRIYRINRIKEDINKWDKDAMDISNGRGCMVFGLAAIAMFFLTVFINARTGENVALIFFGDAIILIFSLWFNGMRKKGHQNKLYIKTDLIIEMEKHFDKVKIEGEELVPSILLARHKSGKEFPVDCRFNIILDKAPADFYGILAQVNINVIESTNYPYFYCVITARSGFGLKKYATGGDLPKSIILEHSDDREAEVIVIRQRTTKTSGYHTKVNACRNIMDTALAISRRILSESRTETVLS